MKKKICRFCRVGQLRTLYAPTNAGQRKAASEFSCTNTGFGIHGSIVRCQSCGVVYVDEDISQQQISTYYEVADDPLYFAEQRAREKTFRGYLRRIERFFPSKGRLLDVGTNTGLFVRLATDDGWMSSGIEPNRWAVEFAKKNYKIKLVARPFVKGVFPKESFDAVTMWDVIEHFTDPPSELAKVYWYLRPGGMFAFSTVDPESPLAKIMGTNWSWYMEMHRVFLPKEVARRYLELAGFRKIVFKPHFRSLSLGYLSTRLAAVNPYLARVTSWVFRRLGVSRKIVPFYANDLYDCYAFK